jgi:hypothetical protein
MLILILCGLIRADYDYSVGLRNHRHIPKTALLDTEEAKFGFLQDSFFGQEDFTRTSKTLWREEKCRNISLRFLGIVLQATPKTTFNASI